MPDRPSAPATALMKFTREDIRNQIEQLARDPGRTAKLMGISRRLWRRDVEDDLLQEAYRRLLKANPAAIDPNIPFDATVVLFMARQAVEWGRKSEPRRLVFGHDAALDSATGPASGRKPIRSSDDDASSGRGGFDVLATWRAAQPRSTPEDDCYAHQVLTRLSERIGHDAPLNGYIIARYVEGLKGEDIRSTLGLTDSQFASLTRRANRMLASIRKELSR